MPCRGYMPPTYAMKGLFSVKSGVFSFHILLLEIISEKKNTSTHYFGLSLNLSAFVITHNIHTTMKGTIRGRTLVTAPKSRH
ncbi:hypothetical protein Taro_030512 [Colocasia esculenta]|uniref:Uncharacterized protein n=1 Tax=Colocasia esculenta TaxID=4460 RepID=A0A843VS58_COLES|nr:hypothetical protein [Colocasia esculenta]